MEFRLKQGDQVVAQTEGPEDRAYQGIMHYAALYRADGALNLPPYLSAKNLKPFIPNDLIYILTHPVQYRATKSGAIGNGLLATAFPKVLRVWQEAYDAGALAPVQYHIGQQAKRLLEGLDEVAIIALVDEATGYQEMRRHDELQQILGANHLQTQVANVMALLRASPTNNPASFKSLFRRAYGSQMEFNLGDD